MQIVIKQLTGPEWTLDISHDTSVRELKSILEQKWKINQNDQRLVFKGKPLEDAKSLGFYNLDDGAKIFLSVKKESSGNSSSNQQTVPEQQSMMSTAAQMLQSLLPQQKEPVKQPTFWEQLAVVLKKYYKEDDIPKIIGHYKLHFKQTVASLSLDDIERLATIGLNREKDMDT